MSELLKIHANGQWELVKAKPQSPEELAAFKAKREDWLRHKHGMKPATEADRKAPAKEKPYAHIGPATGHKAQQAYNERAINKPKVEREPWKDKAGKPRAALSHEHPDGKLIVPEGHHPVDVKPEVRQGSSPAKVPGGQREVIKRPRREEE